MYLRGSAKGLKQQTYFAYLFVWHSIAHTRVRIEHCISHMHTSACTYSKSSVTCPCVCWVVAYLWLLPITYNRMLCLCVADKRMHDRRAWYQQAWQKAGKRSTAKRGRSCSCCHSCGPWFGCGRVWPCSTQKVALPLQSLVRRPAYATAQGTLVWRQGWCCFLLNWLVCVCEIDKVRASSHYFLGRYIDPLLLGARCSKFACVFGVKSARQSVKKSVHPPHADLGGWRACCRLSLAFQHFLGMNLREPLKRCACLWVIWGTGILRLHKVVWF